MPISVIASNVRLTSTGAECKWGHGVDVDILCTLPDGQTFSGEVTLLPLDRECGRSYGSWGGTNDTWVSGGLLDKLRRALDLDDLKDALGEIEATAAELAESV